LGAAKERLSLLGTPSYLLLLLVIFRFRPTFNPDQIVEPFFPFAEIVVAM